MLNTLAFNNYRCFSSHFLPLKQETIVVGRNNAGKSTVIEGFRLLGLVTERYKFLNFYDVPDWLDLPKGFRGVRVDLTGLNLSWENLFHRYQDPPASIKGTFQNGATVSIYLGPNGSMFSVLHGSDGYVARTRGQARSINLPKLSVLPQVMPLPKEETILRPEYVQANLSSYLSPLHFRNQLNLVYDDCFNDFKTLVENSWPGIQIIELQGKGAFHGNFLSLLVRDGDFVAEVSWMGHGLQMWLQTMWFLTRTAGQAIIVLDEPDVYMHPDLQRRLLRFIRGRYKQIVIATHSTELLAEADPSNVLIVDRHQMRSNFTTALPAVQRVLEHIGSAQNLQLTRLWNAKKLLLLEGKDIKFLRRFQDLIFPESEQPFDAIPNMPIGGWSGWPYAIGSAMLLRNAIGDEIATYCIFDSDYHTEEERKDRLVDATNKSIRLHIWSRKEIENYLIVPAAICRLIGMRCDSSTKPPSVSDIEAAIDDIANSLKEFTTDAIAQEIFNKNRSKGIANANALARKIVDQAWTTFNGRISIVSGKEILSRLSYWIQEKFSLSLGANAIAGEILRTELENEIIDVVTAIEKLTEMP
jgi:energy-coupling factor transporter ATP-binding protein EcfA2